MADTSNWSQGFWRGLLRESDGTPSFARVGSLLVVLAVIGWCSHVVVKTHGLPDFGSVTSFTTTSLLSLYGCNKAASTASGIASLFKGQQQ